jgi:threonylcarbamoyladenosine tRNA methylthiotransferase MtaB
VNRHLVAQVGRVHRILTEGPRTGRTEQFTEVRFAADQPEGTVITTPIQGHDGTALTA